MLKRQDVENLLQEWRQHHVLSVYLNADPSQGMADRHKLRLRQLLKEHEAHAPRDCEAVERYIEHEHIWSGRGLAIFSSQEAGLFRVYTLAVAVRSRARWMRSPYVKPLVDLLNDYGDYGVALVDRQGARLFHFHLGHLEEQEGFLGEEVRHTKHGGGSQAAGRRGGISGPARSTEEIVERNIKSAALFASEFFSRHQARRILIAGTQENSTAFTAQLSPEWRQKVVGHFPIEMGAGHVQVLEKAMKVAQQVERERGENLVHSAITAAAKGREGVLELNDTLGAARAGRVHTLLISDGFRAPGYRCQVCDNLSVEYLDTCPFCGGEIEKVQDAVEWVVRKVIRDGGEVEVLHESEALEQAGNIAGLLRY